MGGISTGDLAGTMRTLADPSGILPDDVAGKLSDPMSLLGIQEAEAAAEAESAAKKTAAAQEAAIAAQDKLIADEQKVQDRAAAERATRLSKNLLLSGSETGTTKTSLLGTA